jgi:NAD(P)-dependent dehydrogenase (short-subunit alcohol dehydrogenase family)
MIALAAAGAGADLILHHNRSPYEAEQTAAEIRGLGKKAWVLQADLEDPAQAAALMQRAHELAPVDALVNNAAIFAPGDALATSLEQWQRHLALNLTAPFLLSQGFARNCPTDRTGRILNILDWRALRPGRDHFAYTISKAALASMTQALALTLGPHIQVNGLALGAILPPADGANTDQVLRPVPAGRWAFAQELAEIVVFLLSAPAYMTGEILHLDGGRHLV